MKFPICLLWFLFPCLLHAQEKNLVPNPGFEKGKSSWVVRTATLDERVKHSGKASLKYVNSNPSNYQVILTHIPVEADAWLKFSAWVKGEGISPSAFLTKGGGIYLHAYDKDNKSLGGASPPTMAGTFDWTKVEGIFKVPHETARVAVSLYLVKGNTGTIWFDDVVVEYFDIGRFKNYKEHTANAFHLGPERDAGDGVYIDAQGFTVKDGQRIFPFGIYIGKADKQKIWQNGEAHLRRIKSAGLNTVLSYIHGDRSDAEHYLDLLDSIGLYSIYSLSYLYDGNMSFSGKGRRALEHVADLVSRLKDKPSLLSWYTGDEIEISHMLAALDSYNMIKKRDLSHPVFQVTNKIDRIPLLTSVSDVVGTDPYPIRRSSEPINLELVADWTNRTIAAAGPGIGNWQVLQISTLAGYGRRADETFLTPSETQIRNMMFQAVITGAKGILLYSYHDLWYGHDPNEFGTDVYLKQWAVVENVTKEFASIIPIILSGNEIDVKNLRTDKGVLIKAWEFEGEQYLMLANTMEHEACVDIRNKEVLTLEGYGARFLKID